MEALSVCNAVFAFDTHFPTTQRHRPTSFGRTCTELVELMSSNQKCQHPPPTPNNKLQLKRMLANALLDPQCCIPATQTDHSLTLAGLENEPFRITDGVKTELRDLLSNHEEADPIILHHTIAGCNHQKNVTIFPSRSFFRCHGDKQLFCLIFSCDQAVLWMVPSTCLSVFPSHLFYYFPSSYHEIFRSYNQCQVTSTQKVKVRGQRTRSQRSTPNLTVSRP